MSAHPGNRSPSSPRQEYLGPGRNPSRRHPDQAVRNPKLPDLSPLTTGAPPA
jgi:hypothetical protein